MKKWKWNFLIDASLLLFMAAMTGKGLLLRYVLLPGRDLHPEYGRGVKLEMFGLDRHEWGAIHLYVGYVLVALVVLHIILHWNMIPGMYNKMIPGRAARWLVATAFLAACILLIAFPFLVRPEVIEGGEGEGRGQGRRGRQEQVGRDAPSTPTIAREGRRGEGAGQRRGRAFRVRGSMTLQEVSDAYGVPVDYLTSGLGITESVPSSERLGRLRAKYDFDMGDVEAVIEKYRQSQ